MQFTPAEEVLLETIHMDAPSPYAIPRFAVNYAYAFGLAIPSESEIELALESLSKKELIQIVDSNFIESMQARFIRDHIHGPIHGWPRIGGVDLTQAGFRCLQENLAKSSAKNKVANYPKSLCSAPLEWHRQLFALSPQALESVTANSHQKSFMVLHEPQRCRAWQLVPWLSYRKGYQVEIIEAQFDHDQSIALNLHNQSLSPDLYGHFLKFISSIKDRYFFAGKSIENKFGFESMAELICLAMLSGLFGYGARPHKSVMQDFLDHVLEESFVKVSLDTKAVISRVLSQKWVRSTLRSDAEFVEYIKANTTNCFSIVDKPVVGPPLYLTNTGFRVLTSALNMLWGNDDWNDYVIGIRDTEELSYHYYESYDVALQAIEFRSQYEERSVSGPIEEIGPWCLHWYDVKEHGVRIRLRTIYE